MALRVLMLRRSINKKRAELDELRKKDAEFATREAELETAIGEAETAEQETAVAEAIEAFEADKAAHDEAVTALTQEIEGLEVDLAAEEAKAPSAPVTTPTTEEERTEINMNQNTRTKFFGMTVQERDAFFAREAVKSFISRVRELRTQTRAVTGAELLIPPDVLELLREHIAEYSKLYKHINVKRVAGKARQTVMGIIPEAIWTEMCGKLNELDIKFGAVEVDGYKVGGYLAICNATMEDTDIALGTELINAIGQAIGLALDKAILYGTGTKMPMGIVTRLTQTADPGNSKSSIEWADLSKSNVLAIPDQSGVEFFAEFIKAAGAAKGKYSTGTKFWACSSTTHASLTANALGINAAGALVSGVDKTMPVIGGAIETLDFIPDGVVIGGYGDLYLLAERAGAVVDQSKEVRFIEDQTVIKGVARYDGLPVIAEGFVAIGINGTAPTAGAVTFDVDKANAA